MTSKKASALNAEGAKVREGRYGVGGYEISVEEAFAKAGAAVIRLRLMADDGNKKGALGDLVKAESMMQLALALPGGVLIGALAGTALDKHFHTHWIAIAGIVLGAVAGFTQIFKMAARAMRKDN